MTENERYIGRYFGEYTIIGRIINVAISNIWWYSIIFELEFLYLKSFF